MTFSSKIEFRYDDTAHAIFFSKLEQRKFFYPLFLKFNANDVPHTHDRLLLYVYVSMSMKSAHYNAYDSLEFFFFFLTTE